MYLVFSIRSCSVCIYSWNQKSLVYETKIPQMHIDPSPDRHSKTRVVPTDIYKVPLRSLGMQQLPSASLVRTDMEESLLLIIHIVNLTSNLSELWLFSAAPTLFTLPVTGLNYSSSFQPSAHIYRPIREHATGLCSPLYWNGHLLQVLTHFSLYFTFIWLSSCLNFPWFFSAFICLFVSVSLSLSVHVLSNPDKFENSSFLPALAFHHALSLPDLTQKMDVFQSSPQSR